MIQANPLKKKLKTFLNKNVLNYLLFSYFKL